MNNVLHRLLPAVVLVGAMFAVASYASADDGKPTRLLIRSVTVRFADLNTSSSQGIRVLYDRIAAAASSVCGPSQSAWDANAHKEWKACCRTTIGDAVSQINRPELTALHQKITGKPPGEARLATANPLQR
jgi:UrcA family protein